MEDLNFLISDALDFEDHFLRQMVIVQKKPYLLLKFLKTFEERLFDFLSSKIAETVFWHQQLNLDNKYLVHLNEIHARVSAMLSFEQKSVKKLLASIQKEGFYYSTDALPSSIIDAAKTFFKKNVAPNIQIETFNLETIKFSSQNSRYFFGQDSKKNMNYLCILPEKYQQPIIIQEESKKYVIDIGCLLRLYFSEIIHIDMTELSIFFKVNYLDHLADGMSLKSVADKYIKNNTREINFIICHPASQSILKIIAKIFLLDEKCVYSRICCASIKTFFFDEALATIYPKKTAAGIEHGPDRALLDMQNIDTIFHLPVDDRYYFFDVLYKFMHDKDIHTIYFVQFRMDDYHHSQCIKELCKAAREGKKVYVYIEYFADNELKNNYYAGEMLKSAGAEVIYHPQNLMVHSKILVCFNQEKEKYFSCIGSGNFNIVTMKHYIDFFLLTTNKVIGKESQSYCEHIMFGKPLNCSLLYTRDSILNRIHSSIKNEIEHAQCGKFALLIIKVNLLTSSQLLQEILTACEKGVKVILIVRSEIYMNSILNYSGKNMLILRQLGENLEHARLYYFFDGGQERMFLGSANLTSHSLSKKYEVIVQINNVAHKNKLINEGLLSSNPYLINFFKYDFIQKDFFPCDSTKNMIKSFINEQAIRHSILVKLLY